MHCRSETLCRLHSSTEGATENAALDFTCQPHGGLRSRGLMKYLSPARLLFFAAFALGRAAHAQTQLGPAPGVCDAPLTTAQSRVVDATAFMLPNSWVHPNPDGTYYIDHSPWTVSTAENSSIPVCTDSLFFGIESAGVGSSHAGRTAVWIGGNSFVTAAHRNDFDPSAYTIVFGPLYDGQNCQEFSWSNIPYRNVYTATSTGAVNFLNIDSRYDYITFNVNRYVSGRKPVKIRRSGKPTPGDPLIMVGHPQWAKTSVEVDGEMTGIADYLLGSYMYTNLFPLQGSSGSAIYNLRDEVIDTGVSAPLLGKYDVVNGCADIFRHAPTYSGRTNAPIVDLQTDIPRHEILVSPIDEVVHIGDVGGNLTNSITNYELRAGRVSTLYTVSPVSGTSPNGPSLTTNPIAGTYSLSPTQPSSLTLSASAPNVTTCGIWDYSVDVQDVGNEQNNYLRHRFEIGMKEISVEPSDGWSVEIFGASVPASKSYKVTNLRPTATTVRARLVERSPTIGLPFFLVDGARLSTFTLAPKGQPGDQKDVEIAVNSAATLPPPGTAYSVNASIDIPDTACALTDPLTLPLTLKTGHQRFLAQAPDDQLFAPSQGQPLGTPVILDLPVSGTAGWCVGNAKLDLGFKQISSTGTELPGISSVLDVTLVSPDGTRAHLWALNAIPAQQVPSYVATEMFDFWETPTETHVLRLDDGVTPPLGPDLLSTLASHPVTGTWHVELRRSSGSGVVLPAFARLNIDGASCGP